MVETFFTEFIRLPQTKAEISKAMGPYLALGLNSTIGSVDGIHFTWGMCPKADALRFTGKDKVPTVAYNVICTHDGRVISVAGGAAGRMNDKFLARVDQAIEELRVHELYRGIVTEVFTSSGGIKLRRGVCLAADGGYHRWPIFLMVPGIATSDEELRCVKNISHRRALTCVVCRCFVRMKKLLESIRKDVECLFGRVKKREGILATAMRYHELEKIDNVVKTCLILHNMNHDYDHRHLWAAGVEWGHPDGDPDSPDTDWGLPVVNKS